MRWAVICCALQWAAMLWAWDAIACEVTLCGSKWFCDDVVIQNTTPVLLHYYSVLLCTTKTPVLLCTTTYYPSSTLYYKDSSTTLYCKDSSTTLYYKALQRTTLYYKALQRTTLYYKALQRTTLYYKALQRTTLYYKVLIQYYSPLQSSTLDWSLTHMKRHFHCAEQQSQPPTSANTAPATQRSFMIDPRHIWDVIYNARSNKSHPPTSPNTAPATKNDSHDWSCLHKKCHLQCAEQQHSPANVSKYCACHAKWLSWLIVLTYETSFTMRGATGSTLQPHQILRLPHKIRGVL